MNVCEEWSPYPDYKPVYQAAGAGVGKMFVNVIEDRRVTALSVGAGALIDIYSLVFDK